MVVCTRVLQWLSNLWLHVLAFIVVRHIVVACARIFYIISVSSTKVLDTEAGLCSFKYIDTDQ